MHRFKIQLDHHEPGCGCGCFDNDLNILDQSWQKTFHFSGTREEAEHEMELRKKSTCPSYGNSWTLTQEPRLVVLSGPSGVGKGPIVEWLKKLYYPTLLEGIDIPSLAEMKCRKTKTDRHTGLEDDLGFEGMSSNRHDYLCRGAHQAIDLDVFDKTLKSHDAVIFETYHTNLGFVKVRYNDSAEVVSVFISPLTDEDITRESLNGKNLEHYLPDIMLNSLIIRAQNEGIVLGRPQINELILRAEDSVREMKSSHGYDFVLPNHCYESDPRWKAKELAGEPRTLVDSLQDIILNGNSSRIPRNNEQIFSYYD